MKKGGYEEKGTVFGNISLVSFIAFNRYKTTRNYTERRI